MGTSAMACARRQRSGGRPMARRKARMKAAVLDAVLVFDSVGNELAPLPHPLLSPAARLRADPVSLYRFPTRRSKQ